MSLIVKMAMGDQDANTFGPDPQLGTLCIDRLEHITHGTDTYMYSVKFRAKGWRNNKWSSRSRFQHQYSDGALKLTATAVLVLLKKYPELQAGRYGVPRNRVKCRLCGTVAWSQFGHDFSSCSCGAVSADGGYDHCSRSGEPKNMIEVKEEWQSDLKPAKKSNARSAATPVKVSKTKPTRVTSTSTPVKKGSISASAVTKTGRNKGRKHLTERQQSAVDAEVIRLKLGDLTTLTDMLNDAAVSGIIVGAKNKRAR